MRRLTLAALLLTGIFTISCDAKKEDPRPSGLKNMAPPPIQESVQEGLDVEPNNTYLQATSITLTGDALQWTGTLEPGDVDAWLLKAKAGTICDIAITPESEYDLIADFSNTNDENARHYYDNGLSGQPEMLTNISLTPQGSYLSVRARLAEGAEPVRYRIALSRVYAANENNIVEAEINDERADAMTVYGGVQVEGVLYPRGDVDYYRVALKTASTVSFDLPDGAHEVAIESNNKVIWSEISRKAQILKSDMLPPDLQDVIIRFKSLEELKEPHHYTFSVNELEKVPDEIEPNNTVDKAQTIQGNGQNLEFSLLDDADVDIFRLMAEPTKVYRARLVGPQSGQAKLAVLAPDGSVRTDARIGDMVACDVSPAGQNSILLKVLPGIGVWPLNYRISVDSEDMDKVEHEPNASMEQATAIEPGMRLNGHIFPSDDVDYYQIKLPEYPNVEGPIGKLQIDIDGGYVAQLQLKLQDSAGYEISQQKNEQYSRPMRLSLDAPNGTYYLVVSGAGDDCVKPYGLQVTFEPNEQAIASLTALVAPTEVVAPPSDAGEAAAKQEPASADVKAEQVKAEPAVAELNNKPAEAPVVDIAIDDLIQAAQENKGDEPKKEADKPSRPDEDEDAF